MDLFDYMRSNTMEKEARWPPGSGQPRWTRWWGSSILSERTSCFTGLSRRISWALLYFYGPPGTGKTTLAKVIAGTTSARFKQLNATVAGKKDMEEVVQEAKDALGMYGQKTILFVDEIHRFNKSQQDYLLPFVEDGTLLLIGATTENPYFEVNGALISRSRIFELKPLAKEDVAELLRRAVYDKEKGMGSLQG